MKAFAGSAFVKGLLVLLVLSIDLAALAQAELPQQTAANLNSSASAVPAAALPAGAPAAAAGESSGAATDLSFLRVFGGLGLVIALIIAGFFLARKFFPQYFTRQADSRCIKLIESLSLGDRRSIARQAPRLLGSEPGQLPRIPQPGYTSVRP